MEQPSLLRRLVERVAEVAIRRALGYAAAADVSLPGVDVDELIGALAPRLASFDGVSYRCALCGRGPFTRRGLYLHMKRVHLEHVRELVEAELRRRIFGGLPRG